MDADKEADHAFKRVIQDVERILKNVKSYMLGKLDV